MTQAKSTTQRKTFTIPVFPHVKKFIQKNYRFPSIIKVDEYDILGKFVTLALNDNRPSNEYGENYYRDRLTAKLTFMLTARQARQSPRIHKLMRLNIYMDKEFKDHMIIFISAQVKLDVPAYEATRNFLEYYDLDEKEYSLEAAYKSWQRYWNKEVV